MEVLIMQLVLFLGAGDGAVTEKFSKYFRKVYVTEKSKTMSWRLKEKGYNVLDADKWHEQSNESYDVISCMNLLDRCDRPLDLLQSLHVKLKKGTGRLILAVVLPLSQYVESGNYLNF